MLLCVKGHLARGPIARIGNLRRGLRAKHRGSSGTYTPETGFRVGGVGRALSRMNRLLPLRAFAVATESTPSCPVYLPGLLQSAEKQSVQPICNKVFAR